MNYQLLTTKLFCILLLAVCGPLQAMPMNIEFEHIGIRDGLSNSQINVIFKDSRGYVWIGTQSGLNRYDGYRFKTYFYKSTDSSSLPNNWISEIQETREHTLLIRTPMGYTSFYMDTETFSYDPASWMQRHGLEGTMDVAYIDKHKNYIVASNGRGVYYLDDSGVPFLFAFGKQIPKGVVTAITEKGRSILLNYDDGHIVSLIPSEHRVSWISSYITRHRKTGTTDAYRTYVSRFGNLWVMGNGHTWLYNQRLKRWFDNVNDYLRAQNYGPVPEGKILIKSIVEDHQGNLWMGTEHRGLIRISAADLSVHSFDYDPDNQFSVADNTIQSLYLDPSGDLWVGTYKNGLSFYSPNTARFNTVPVGDVCTIVEDNDHNYWCGTNDRGIMIYYPREDAAHHIGKEETGLGSEVIVSGTKLPDGSLWFGAFNGGLACYRDGRWMSYRAGDGSGLACDNVWSLCPTKDGRLVIGTLGNGLQIYDPRTQRFDNIDMSNSKLTSNYINSVSLLPDGRILVGHSSYYSIVELKTRKVENFNPDVITKGSVPSPAVNQAIIDSRGILWMATASGGCAYDRKTNEVANLDWTEGVTGAVACSLVEDSEGYVWLVGDHGVSRIEVRKGAKGWEYYSEAFNEYDGLQKRQFNFRSILRASNGDVVLGGQDGINIIPPKELVYKNAHARVLFAGLRIFDKNISVGEEFNRNVVLNKSLDDNPRLTLQHDENAFTILLATNEVTIPATNRFIFQLEGFDDEWHFTIPGVPSVTFTSLPEGHYTLRVKAVLRNGAVSDEMSTLEIYVRPPIYRTWLAYLLYALVIVAVGVRLRRQMLRRQLMRLRMQHIKEEAEYRRQMDEMKLNFFTSVSHELRTPLALIVSPLHAMMKTEKDEKKKKRLAMVHRNAVRLYKLVNQLLDFRKMDQKKQQLETVTGDVVAFVSSVVDNYHLLSSRDITLEFHSELPQLSMSFDPDKLQKIMDNLLFNAFKYTPTGGRVAVLMTVSPKYLNDEDALIIKVSDTGEGVPDEDKKSIFDPFYQASNHTSNPFGGSGVGLSLVKDFVKLHDGQVYVEDNEEGGSVFVVVLPVRHDASLKQLSDLPTLADVIEMPNPAELSELSDFSDKSDMSDSSDFSDLPEKATAPSPAKPLRQRADVLLVDDAEDFLAFMTEVLSEHYRVRTAHDGEEALERVAEQLPDIILSDVMMPRMDGRELCKRIKGDEKTAKIPFIMLTARVADTQKVEGMALGADDYLTKPFNLELLFLRIENLLKWSDAATDKPQLLEPELQTLEVTSADEELVQSATRYVEDNLSNTDLTVELLAAGLGMSRVQLYRRLLSLTGQTPTEFVRTIRLRHAEQILRTCKLTVSEVAYRVGFNNPRYFSKYFSEMYGMTPSQYIAQQS